MPPKAASNSEGAPDWWDASWPARSVEFKITAVATFHPSVEAASIRLTWLDASGQPLPAPVLLGPLSSFQVEEAKSNPRWPGAITASMEKPLGSMAITPSFIRGLQKAALPVHVLLGGADPEAKAGGEGRISPGPLLLAHDGSNEKLPPRPLEVSATGIETVGLVGLHRLDIKLSTDTPVLSQEMLERLMPLCFTIDTIKGLPNESWLADKCEDVWAEVYPESSTGNTMRVAEEFPKVRLSSRPHSTVVRFAEPIVWLLGCLPLHSIREWLLNEELVIEVHDRDLRSEEVTVEDDANEETQALAERTRRFNEGIIHPHGVARFKLAPLLGGLRSLSVGLRADVLAMRGNKKQLHTQIGLVAKGAEKREFAPDYLAKGCTCSIRAAMAVPIPEARHLQATEETKDQEEWCATEQRQPDSNIWAVPSPAKTDASKDAKDLKRKESKKSMEESESQDVASSPILAPTLRCRAKVSAHGEEISGPWRTCKEAAEEDEKHLKSILEEVVDVDVETVKQAAASLHEKPSHGLDRRYERYGRAVIVLDDKDVTSIKNVLKHIREFNAEALQLDPESNDFVEREFHEQEKANVHLDVITGFCILDGKSRIMVLEGLRERGMKRILEVVDRNSRRNGDGFKLLSNANVGFSERLYSDFGPRLKQIKLKMPLEELGEMGWHRTDALNGMTVPAALLAMKTMHRFHPLRQGNGFPKAAELEEMEANEKYCEPVPAAMLEGNPMPQKGERKSQVRMSQLGGASFSYSAPTFEEEAARVGRTTLPGRTLDHSKSKRLRGSGTTLRPEEATMRFEKQVARSQVLLDLAVSLPDPPPPRQLLDTRNDLYENTLALRKSASAPVKDFHQANRASIAALSEANTQKNIAANIRQPRPCPFMEGKEVHNYSTQKLNSTELQKEWLREKLVKDEEKYFFSYDETHMSNNFDLSKEGAESGIRRHHARCPTDTYARLPHDDRPVWRTIPSRPKEEFRKPPKDLGIARGDELHEAFVDGEWFKMPIGDERHKPIRTDVRFEPSKIPHHRLIKEQPFDRSKVVIKGKDFGPKSMWESVHYNAHGAPGDDRMSDVALQNATLRDEEKSKIIGNTYIRTFSQGNTRKGITCTDREERLLKDEATKVLRGSGIDDPLPTSIRIFEPYHAFGNPNNEFQARLRENDQSAPYDVSTGGYIKRDPDVGLKKSQLSGTLGKAPWQHDNTILQRTRVKPKSEPKHFTKYVSSNNFDHSCKLANPTHTESHVWKNATRTAVAQSERSLKPYRRPVDYGCQHVQQVS